MPGKASQISLKGKIITKINASDYTQGLHKHSKSLRWKLDAERKIPGHAIETNLHQMQN